MQYLMKEVSNEVDFFFMYLQIDTMVFDRDGQALPNFPKQQVCDVFTISHKGS